MYKRINFNAFDKTNAKVPNLNIAKVKELAKAGTTQLTNKQGERTIYRLIVGYFVDDKGKEEGHFLNFGEDTKLTKHFREVEMKPVKPDKSMSAKPEKACTGEVYVKKINGNNVVHFEPSKESKVRKAKWPKILKDLKPFLKGLKAVVVLEGKVIGLEEEKEDSGTTKSSTSDTANMDVAPMSSSETIKALILGITGILTEDLPKVIVPNIKAKKVSQEDADITNNLFDKLDQLKAAYETAEAHIQQKIEKHYDSITLQIPKLENIKTVLNNLLGVSEENNGGADVVEKSETVRALKELLAYAIKKTDEIEKGIDEIQDEISSATSQIIKGGEELLEALFN